MDLLIDQIVPIEAGQNWKLEFFQLSNPIESHHHRVQRQIIIVAEGELEAIYGTDGSKRVYKGDLVAVDPGISRSLIPKGKVQFFTLDISRFVYPQPKERLSLPETYFGPKITQDGYSVYELLKGNDTDQPWSVALLEIRTSPKHFHRIEREIFVVVEGTLQLDVDEVSHKVEVGGSFTVERGSVHQLFSATKSPVRVLCFNFPAFDPEDMNLSN